MKSQEIKYKGLVIKVSFLGDTTIHDENGYQLMSALDVPAAKLLIDEGYLERIPDA